MRATFDAYQSTIEPGLQRLLHGYTPSAVARVFAGQGSLGVRNFLMLVTGRRDDDALILQLKEATTSALGYGGIDVEGAPHEGERVIGLQKALQAVSDPLLGWTSIGDEQYYVRQWRDMKQSPKLIEKPYKRGDREAYARLCGTTLARAHSRTIEGDGITPVAREHRRRQGLHEGGAEVRPRLRGRQRGRPEPAARASLTLELGEVLGRGRELLERLDGLGHEQVAVRRPPGAGRRSGPISTLYVTSFWREPSGMPVSASRKYSARPPCLSTTT